MSRYGVTRVCLRWNISEKSFYEKERTDRSLAKLRELVDEIEEFENENDIVLWATVMNEGGEDDGEETTAQVVADFFSRAGFKRVDEENGLFRKAIGFDDEEDADDLQEAQEVLAENEKTIPFDEICKRLGFSDDEDGGPGEVVGPDPIIFGFLNDEKERCLKSIEALELKTSSEGIVAEINFIKNRINYLNRLLRIK